MMDKLSELTEEYVDVWQTRLDLADNIISEYFNLLDKKEQQRALKFKIEDKYRQFVISRGLLRQILGLTLAMDPSSLQFHYEKLGKPYVQECSAGKQINFNVSHSHDIAVIAVTLDRVVGIDIEKQRDDIDHNKLAKRYFSSLEYDCFNQCHDDIRSRVFYTCWTRKEAVVKATGKGIAYGLNKFDVSIHPDDPPEILHTHWDPNEKSQWIMRDLDTDVGFVASLASKGKPFRIRYRDPSDLTMPAKFRESIVN